MFLDEENRRQLLLVPKHHTGDINHEEFQVIITTMHLFASKEMWKSNHKLLVQQMQMQIPTPTENFQHRNSRK